MVSAMILGLHLAVSAVNPTILVQNGVPTLDSRAACKAEAASGLRETPDVDTCVQSEQDARQQLAKSWNSFAAGDRTTCTGLSSAGGQATYIELLTCLEVMRDSHRLSRENATTDDVSANGTRPNRTTRNGRRNGSSNEELNGPTNLGVPPAPSAPSTVGSGRR